MGREVRRVKPGWTPPVEVKKSWDRGLQEFRWRPEFVPHHDRSLREAQEKWDAENALWERGEHEHQEWLLLYHTEGQFFTAGKHPDIYRAKTGDVEVLPEDARITEPVMWDRYAEDRDTVIETRWLIDMDDLIANEPYSDYAGERPDDPRNYRPDWAPEEITGYALYETVSEGTPVSPIFSTREEFVEWLITENGFTPERADVFADDGWVPSMMVINSPGQPVVVKDSMQLAREGPEGL